MCTKVQVGVSGSAGLKLMELHLCRTFLLFKRACSMNLVYLRMFLHPCLEFHEDVMAEGVAPTLLFAWTALQDC